jgi:DnaJ-domain-containing protein 1
VRQEGVAEGRAKARAMKLNDAAGLLGVPANADAETLKAAYRRMALRWHPDKVRGRVTRAEPGAAALTKMGRGLDLWDHSRI